MGTSLPSADRMPLHILEVLSDAVVLTDLGGIIQFCNTSWAEFVGKSVSQLTGQKIFDAVDQELAPLLHRAWGQISSGQAWHGTWLKSQGQAPPKHPYVDVHVYPNQMPGPSTGLVAVVIRTIKVPAVLQEGSDSIPLMPMVFGAIAHDLNNITTVMNCTLDLTLHGDEPSPDDLREMQGSVREIEQLVSALMLLAGRAPIERNRCQVTDLQRQAVKFMRHTLPAGWSVAWRPGVAATLTANTVALEFLMVCLAHRLVRESGSPAGVLDIAAVEEQRAGRPYIRIDLAVRDESGDSIVRSPTTSRSLTAREISPSMTEETFLAAVIGVHQARLEQATFTDGSRRYTLSIPADGDPSRSAGSDPVHRRVLIMGGSALSRAILAGPLENRGFQVISAAIDVDAMDSELLAGVDVAVLTGLDVSATGAQNPVNRLRSLHAALPLIVVCANTQVACNGPNTKWLASPCNGAAVAELVEEFFVP